MGVRCSRAAAPAGERSSLSAPKGSLHPWFSETCSSAAVEGFPKGLRRGDSLRRASVRGILRPRGATGGSAHRIYNATRAGQGGGAESNQTAGPRGRPPAPGPVEPTVLPRHQSTAQGIERSGGGVAPRSREAVSPLQRVVIGPLVFYQRFVSPALPSACRFHPALPGDPDRRRRRGGWPFLRRRRYGLRLPHCGCLFHPRNRQADAAQRLYAGR